MNNNCIFFNRFISNLPQQKLNLQDKKIINQIFKKTLQKTNKQSKDLKLKKILSKGSLFKIYLKKMFFKEIQPNLLLELMLVTKPSRSHSGVLPISVAMDGYKFSCKYDCHFCPNETIKNGAPKNIARSYLSNEGTFKRGASVNFDPFKQTIRRLLELEVMGHMPDKLEFIILGGTFHCYGKEIYTNFIHQLFYACNVYYHFSIRYRGKFASKVFDWIDKNPFYYNLDLQDLLPCFEKLRPIYSLEKEKHINQSVLCARIIGIVPETRPDQINIKTLYELRQLGVTRFQLGTQSTNDNVLKIVNRGHLTKSSLRALEKGLDNGFKVSSHIMPDMPGSTIKKDIQVIKRYFYSDDLQFDRIKLYNCLDVPYSEIRKWKNRATIMIQQGDKQKVLQIHQKMIDGEIKGLTKDDFVWLPNSEHDYNNFFKMMTFAMESVPPWTRLDRLNRDFQHAHKNNNRLGYESANIKPNLYQLCKNQLIKNNKKAYDIRSREIKNNTIKNFTQKTKLFIRCYRSSNGTEFFISLEIPNYKPFSKDDAMLLGLVRLRIPDVKNTKNYLPIFKSEKTARIRELHVFGNLKPVNTISEKKSNSQHLGIGSFLLGIAEEISDICNIKKIAIISGVGVRGFYQKKGYKLEDEYMIKKLNSKNKLSLTIFNKTYCRKYIKNNITNFTIVKQYFKIKSGKLNEKIYSYPNIKNAELIIFQNIKYNYDLLFHTIICFFSVFILYGIRNIIDFIYN